MLDGPFVVAGMLAGAHDAAICDGASDTHCPTGAPCPGSLTAASRSGAALGADILGSQRAAAYTTAIYQALTRSDDPLGSC